MDRLLRAAAGVGLAEAESHDLGRLLRGAALGRGSSRATGCCPRCGRRSPTSAFDLDEQRNVELDVEQRPTKSPRAFCSPIEVPDRVVLVIQPIGGPDDWHALFHEAGHTEHFAHTSPT